MFSVEQNFCTAVANFPAVIVHSNRQWIKFSNHNARGNNTCARALASLKFRAWNIFRATHKVRSLAGKSYVQRERPCCISIYKLEPKARVVYLMQHGHGRHMQLGGVGRGFSVKKVWMFSGMSE